MVEFKSSKTGFIKISQPNGNFIININEISNICKTSNCIEIKMKDLTVLKQNTTGEEESEKILDFFWDTIKNIGKKNDE